MITGHVDDYGRARVPVVIRHPVTGVERTVETWIDTAFTGCLLLTTTLVADLNLSEIGTAPSAFADGSHKALPTYSCLIDWFGKTLLLELPASPNRFALLGIQLLEDLVLTIDYPAQMLTLTPSSSA